MTLRCCISALLIVILGTSPGLAAPRAKAPQAKEAPAGDGGPMAVFEDIEQGWTSGDADLILRHFGSNKVTIVIDGSGPGGSYSKDQGYYVFKELFKATTTRKFVFVQVRSTSEANASTFAIAERRFQRKDDGRQIKDKVYISLHQERSGDSGSWVIDEIKSIR